MIFDRGDSCVDGAVLGLVTAGRLPVPRRITCEGSLADTYLPLPPRTAAGYADPWATAHSVLGAVLDNPLYGPGPDLPTWWWAATRAAPPATRSARDGTVHVWLEDCASTDDVPVDGYVSVADGGNGDARATLVLPFAQLSVAWDGSVTGEFRGQPVG